MRQVTALTAYDNEGWVPFSALNQANLLTGLLTGELKTLPGAEAAGLGS